MNALTFLAGNIEKRIYSVLTSVTSGGNLTNSSAREWTAATQTTRVAIWE